MKKKQEIQTFPSCDENLQPFFRANACSGGLENPAIREAVCAILESGKRAFQERAKRLRVSI